jgi:pimeloyl-ACP methyl ester carboxylesterase
VCRFSLRGVSPLTGRRLDCYAMEMAAETRTRTLLCVLSFAMACHGSAYPPASVARSIDSSTSPGGRQGPRRQATFDQRVDVGGLELHIHCEGAGVPLVVFDSGLGQGSEAWSRVLRPVASFTRTCVYDRASHGQSDPAHVPHSNRQMARELYALLSNSAEIGPYVLVGHSMGGTNVQLFLEEHGTSVAGMVLVDASPEPPALDRIPAPALADFKRNIAALEGLDLETLLAGFDELRASKRTLGDEPLAILVAGRALQDPNFDNAEAQRLLIERQESQKPLLRLSSNSVLVIAHDSAHHIPDEAPDIVIRAVQAVVQAARTGGRLSESSIQGDVEAPQAGE